MPLAIIGVDRLSLRLYRSGPVTPLEIVADHEFFQHAAQKNQIDMPAARSPRAGSRACIGVIRALIAALPPAPGLISPAPHGRSRPATYLPCSPPPTPTPKPPP